MNVGIKSLASMLLAGVVTSVAAQSGAMQRGPAPFSEFDTDANGFISEQEFLATRSTRRAVRAEQGYPLRNADSAPGFATFDSNGDGQLSPEEFAGGHRVRPNFQGGSGMGPGMGMGRSAGQAGNMPTFSDFDLDSDGAIVEEEFIAARGKRIAERASLGYAMQGLSNAQPFAEIDSDGDGKVTAQEFASAQAKHRMNQAQ